MLFVSLFVKLQIYKVDSLFLGQCRAGKGKDILQLGGKQVDLYERTGYDVAFVVKFKSYGDIERVVSAVLPNERSRPFNVPNSYTLLLYGVRKLAELIVRRYG